MNEENEVLVSILKFTKSLGEYGKIIDLMVF